MDQCTPNLLFGERYASRFSDIETFAKFYGASDHHSLLNINRPEPFSFKGAAIKLPKLLIFHSASDPCAITTNYENRPFSLIVPLIGHGTIGLRRHPREWNAQDNLIFNALNGETEFTFSEVRSQVLFEIETSHLTQTFIACIVLTKLAA